MTNALATLVLLIILTAAAGAEWWRLRSRFRDRLRELQERHRREHAQAGETLAAARRQIASLQHQLTGARLKAQLWERQFVAGQSDRRRGRHAGRPLLVMDDDLPARAFADKGIGRSRLG